MSKNTPVSGWKTGLALVASLCAGAASLIAEVIPLDLTVGYNYDGYISTAEADHAYLYDPPGDWNKGARMVPNIFGEHTFGTDFGRLYCWDDQATSGLPANGVVTTSYGDFQLSTMRDAEPVGGFVQPSVGTTPSLPVASNVVRVFRPHSGSTGNPGTITSIDLPVAQQGHYDSCNFLVSGNNRKVYIYADYDDGFGGVDSQLIYESPGTPKTSSETGFPEANSGGTPDNPDIVAALTMDKLWSQAGNYSLIRDVTATLWTFDDPLALDDTKELIGFTLAIHDSDNWQQREAVIYAISANSVESALYVDINNGSDTTGDGSVGNPYQTLQYVLNNVAVGGETIALQDGHYGNFSLYKNGDLFNDWVTIKPAPGAAPEIGRFTILGPTDSGGQGRIGGYKAYLRLEGLIIRDGWDSKGGQHWGLYNCLIERLPPHNGSVEALKKAAVSFQTGKDITIEGCEITNTGTGIGGSGHDITVRGNYIHDGTHDGIRVAGWWNSLVEDNIICRFDDGAADGEGVPSFHCDLIHIFIQGDGSPGMENNGVVFRYNVLFDVESQGVQFNNYYESTLRNKNITFEYNVFGPTNANLFNNAAATDGLIFRHNTIAYFPEGRDFGRWHLDNHKVRIGESTGVQIYNNNLVEIGVDPGAEIDILDWNILLKNPVQSPKGVDGRRAFGRFTQVGVDYELVNAADFDGALESTSPAINAGTYEYAPTILPGEDLAGTLIDLRPDIGAWEEPGNSPAAEPLPIIYNDLKTTFVDDFEDGHYKDVDPWLNDVATQGLSWYRPSGYDDHLNEVIYTNGPDRNALFSPKGANGETRISWLITEQGADWAEYDLYFLAKNAYVAIGSGVTVLTIDEDNAYWLDISRDNGRLIRIMNGVQTILATDSDIELPHNGAREYFVTVRQNGTGITIEVDADDDGSVDFSYTDTDPTALSTFTAGGIGVHDDCPQVHNRTNFDNFQVDVVSFAP
ncbi:right-handed parallel beta-helix repeat-containing protein [Cerasicoccus fimbriatus]|uniref:right-handed parallel beta-helix repeat-containing protein n=1 Tax=Cerasicoccus fimbriatus TaxID=3014554 RepID=UPI0022B55E37|nr:right-handed parallel beta-helix repeat-containing protein [Cerasicoccus sp. TK19100]